MKYIKKYNENNIIDFKKYSEYSLSFLIDKGIKIRIYEDNNCFGLSTTLNNVDWSNVKYDIINYIEYLILNYKKPLILVEIDDESIYILDKKSIYNIESLDGELKDFNVYIEKKTL